MSLLGSRVLRTEDPKFLTTGGVYAADLRDERLDGAAYVTYVRSTMAHGRIVSIDTTDAAAAPGVIAVFTADDLDVDGLPPKIPFFPAPMMNRPFLAKDTVRFAGEPVAVIVTESPQQGEDAAELVFVDIDPLPAVIDLEHAASDEVLLFPEVGTNTMIAAPATRPDDFFDGCDVVVTARIRNNRVAGAPLEVRSAAAAWIDGRATLWTSTQAPHNVKKSLVDTYGLDEGQVHVIAPDVGGGFGPKIDPYPEEGLLPWIARRIDRPVRWTETRSENMVAMGHGRAHLQDIEIGGTRDGKVLAYRLDVLADGGSFAAIGAILPVAMTKMMAAGTYAIPKIDFGVQVVATNTVSTVAYRGAGRPEATAAIERAMDLFAAEIGMDPAEVRRVNLVPAADFPHTTPMGATYDNGEYEQALQTALDAVGYDELRADQARRREAGAAKQLGSGVSTYVEITAGPNPVTAEHATVEVLPDGSARVLTGTSPHGQGHATSWAMLASDSLGIPMDRITVVHGDTDLVPSGVGTFGSRSLQVGGSAVFTAAGQVVDKARELAAGLLEAAADDVVLDTDAGAFHVAGTPSVNVGWTDVVAAAGDDGLKVALEFAGSTATFPFGAHVAVVEVDTEIGEARLVRILTVDDAGRIVNPMLVEGQRHGGIAQGAAQALLEEIRYDVDGNPVTSNFADYAIISAAELPSFELVTMETPTPANPLGAKGIGESGTIGSTPAVQSAVVDAVAHLGVRHVDMPTTPEKVWRAIAAAAGGDDGTSSAVAGSGFGATAGIDADTAAAIESNPDVGA